MDYYLQHNIYTIPTNYNRLQLVSHSSNPNIYLTLFWYLLRKSIRPPTISMLERYL